ncbi:CdiA C-terminal domain-containing protein [Micromonospora zhanjiangensis]|uniref:tRNA nuclease CdiA C-terminal domain-containing protein n=1 Tax=Micromonospora zhanjiangensis TaxID=1522057 RepID=A0ABV8KHH3_9ACTN
MPWKRRPSGPPGGSPTGRPAGISPRDNGTTRRSLEMQNPDYLIEGHVFDCYSPKPDTKVRNVWTEVSKKVADDQTQRVVLNLQDWRGDLSAMRTQFDDWPMPGLKEAVALTRNGSLVQIVPRH